MAAKIHTTQDAPLAPLKNKVLAVIGFGSQGKAQALNLKDCGLKVIIGLPSQSPYGEVAKALGFKVMNIAAAVQAAKVIFLAVPEAMMPVLYAEHIAPHLGKGQTLLFAHGFAVHFKTLKPKKQVDVILVSPQGPGACVRSLFVAGMGVPGLIAIHQDVSGKAKANALAWAAAIGCARAGIYETSFREETVTHLFGSQCVLGGGVSALIRTGYDTLVDAGYSPVMAYYKCLHELKHLTDLMSEQGITGLRAAISQIDRYSALTGASKIIDARVGKHMAVQLKAIESGQFAQEWAEECETGGKHLKTIRKIEDAHPIEKIGDKLRSTMSWIKRSQTRKPV